MGVGVFAPVALAAASQIAGFDKELRMKSQLDDIYETLAGMYVLDKKSVPDNAIRMKVDARARAESNNITITMMMRLGGAGTYDPNILIGQENIPQTKTVTIYRNIVRKAVTSPGYGNEYLDANPYGLYEKWIDQLSVWNKEHHGWSIRQTVLEQYGESLVHGRTIGLCPRNWTPNILVAGLDRTTMQVAFNNNNAPYTTAIVNRILMSGGGNLAPLVTQTLNQPNLSNAQNLALENRIEMLKLPGVAGGRGWVMTMSELQATYLTDPVWSARNLGTIDSNTKGLTDEMISWPGVFSIYKNFLLVQDMRQPTLRITGTSEPWGLAAGYVEPGDDDQRERDDLNTRDTVFILGANGIIDWNPEKLHFIKQDDDYGMVQGRGTALVEGLCQPIYDRAGVHEQFSTMVLICSLPSYV